MEDKKRTFKKLVATNDNSPVVYTTIEESFKSTKGFNIEECDIIIECSHANSHYTMTTNSLSGHRVDDKLVFSVEKWGGVQFNIEVGLVANEDGTFAVNCEDCFISFFNGLVDAKVTIENVAKTLICHN